MEFSVELKNEAEATIPNEELSCLKRIGAMRGQCELIIPFSFATRLS
jgi:hypothetical protein